MKKLVSAGGVLFNKENKVYLINKIKKDEWSLPKGKVENGEDVSETALREVKEETGYKNIEILDSKPIENDNYVFRHPKNGNMIDKDVYYFLMKIENEENGHTKEMDKEGLEGNWFFVEDALEILKFNTVKDIVEKAYKLISN